MRVGAYSPQDLVPDINAIRNQLEGPKPLRAIAAIAGILMTACSVLGLINLSQSVMRPFDTIVKAYMACFGLIAVAIETKSAGDQRNQLKSFVYRWAPFTSIVGGKGITYIFFGTLGLSFGYHHVLLFASGCLMTAVGVIYCLIHFAKVDTLADKYEASQLYTASQYGR